MLLLERKLGVLTVLLVSCYIAVALPGARYAAHAQYTVSTHGRGQTQRSKGKLNRRERPFHVSSCEIVYNKSPSKSMF